MTLHGRINLMNAVHANDPRPIDEECACYTCRHFSRAYLRHLIVAKEMLVSTLVSIHNLYTLLELMRRMRQAIIEGRFEDWVQEMGIEPWQKTALSPSEI